MSTHAGITPTNTRTSRTCWHGATSEISSTPTPSWSITRLELLRTCNERVSRLIVSAEAPIYPRLAGTKPNGVPPEQVISAALKTKFELLGTASLHLALRRFVRRLRPGKPGGIAKYIGRRRRHCFCIPTARLAMLQYTTVVLAPFVSLSTYERDVNTPMIANLLSEN